MESRYTHQSEMAIQRLIIYVRKPNKRKNWTIVDNGGWKQKLMDEWEQIKKEKGTRSVRRRKEEGAGQGSRASNRERIKAPPDSVVIILLSWLEINHCSLDCLP